MFQGGFSAEKAVEQAVCMGGDQWVDSQSVEERAMYFGAITGNAIKLRGTGIG